VRLYHSLFLESGLHGIKAFLFLCDTLGVFAQCLAIQHIYSKEKYYMGGAFKKDRKTASIIQLILIFNPLALISPAVHNLGIVNHMLLSIYTLALVKTGYSLATDLLSGLCLYIDPMLIYVIVPVRVTYHLLNKP
jgi:hypothetical protein